MAEFCSCKDGIINFGQPTCVDQLQRAARLIFVNYYDDAGAVNSIKSTDVLDQTYWDGKFNGALDQRMYPTEDLTTTSERAEPVTQDVGGIPRNVKQGLRTYEGSFVGGIASPTYQKALESISCRTMGFFIVDAAGAIIGMYNEVTGELDPIKIQNQTFYALFGLPTEETFQGIMIRFIWDEKEKDSDLRLISQDDIPVDMLSQRPMTTVEFSPATSITTTTFTTTMEYLYGGAFNRQRYKGAVIGDFTLLDTGGTPIVITTVTENPAGSGSYDFVFPLQPSGDITLSYSITTGAGFESVVDLVITIP